LSGNAPIPTGSLPGTAPYRPAPDGGPPPGRIEAPPPAPRAARLAFVVSMAAAFAMPVWYLIIPSVFPLQSKERVLAVSAAVGASIVVLAFVLSVRAAAARDAGRGALALASVVVSCIAVGTNLVGWLLGSVLAKGYA
jgi:hypothetical protein